MNPYGLHAGIQNSEAISTLLNQYLLKTCSVIRFEQCHEKSCFKPEDNKGADKPAYLQSLINPFIACGLDLFNKSCCYIDMKFQASLKLKAEHKLVKQLRAEMLFQTIGVLDPLYM